MIILVSELDLVLTRTVVHNYLSNILEKFEDFRTWASSVMHEFLNYPICLFAETVTQKWNPSTILTIKSASEVNTKVVPNLMVYLLVKFQVFQTCVARAIVK